MGNIFSFNYKKFTKNTFNHMFRKNGHAPSYLLPKELRGQNVDKEFFNLGEYWDKENQQQQGKKSKTLKKNALFEAVINVKHDTTPENIEEFIKEFEKHSGYKVSAYSLHLDEGTLVKQGEWDNKLQKIAEEDTVHPNYHCHLVYTTFVDQKQQKKFMTQTKFKFIQDLGASILGMERGQPKSVTGRVRLEHKQYKQEIQKQNVIKRDMALLRQKYHQEEQTQQEITQRGIKAYKERLNALKTKKKPLLMSQDVFERLNTLEAKSEAYKEITENQTKRNMHLTSKIEELENTVKSRDGEIKQLKEAVKIEIENNKITQSQLREALQQNGIMEILDLKKQLQELEKAYKQARKELIDSKQALQSDYQALKAEKQEIEKELKALKDKEPPLQKMEDLKLQTNFDDIVNKEKEKFKKLIENEHKEEEKTNKIKLKI